MNSNLIEILYFAYHGMNYCLNRTIYLHGWHVLIVNATNSGRDFTFYNGNTCRSVDFHLTSTYIGSHIWETNKTARVVQIPRIGNRYLPPQHHEWFKGKIACFEGVGIGIVWSKQDMAPPSLHPRRPAGPYPSTVMHHSWIEACIARIWRIYVVLDPCTFGHMTMGPLRKISLEQDALLLWLRQQM